MVVPPTSALASTSAYDKYSRHRDKWLDCFDQATPRVADDCMAVTPTIISAAPQTPDTTMTSTAARRSTQARAEASARSTRSAEIRYPAMGMRTVEEPMRI